MWLMLERQLAFSTTTSGPFYQNWLTFIPAWISNNIHHKVGDEITYPLLNLNGAIVEV